MVAASSSAGSETSRRRFDCEPAGQTGGAERVAGPLWDTGESYQRLRFVSSGCTGDAQKACTCERRRPAGLPCYPSVAGLPAGRSRSRDSLPSERKARTDRPGEPAYDEGLEESEGLLTAAAFGIGAGAHAAALGLVVVQSGAGARLLDRLGLRDSLATHERLLYGWVAGFSATTLVWMVLAAAGALGPVSISLVLAALTAFAAPAVRELAGRAWRVLRTLDRPGRVTVAVVLVVFALWVQPWFVETLLPNSDWDSALYHLPLADRYLTGSLWGRDPYFPAFSFPGAVHLLYAALLALGLEAAIVPLNFDVTLLSLVATVAMARRIGNRAAPTWAALAFATTPILWQLGVDPRIDGFLVLFVTLATYALARFTQKGDDAYLELAALCLGAAIGTKYTALPFVLAIAALGVGFRLWGSAGTRGLTRLLATMALLVAVPNGAWYVANGVIHGDPVFPLLRGDYRVTSSGEHVHLSRADEEQEPGDLRDSKIQRRLRAFEQAPMKDPAANLLDLVTLLREPDRFAVKPNHGMGALLLLSLAMPLVIRRRPENRRAGLVVWGLGWGGYLLLGSQTNLLRYAAPVLPLLAATLGVAVSAPRYRGWLRGVPAVIALGGALLLLGDHQAENRKLALLQPDTALGPGPSIWWDRERRIDWLKRVGYNFTPPMAWVSERIDALVASGRMSRESRILMVGEGKTRLLDCEALPDSSWFAHRFVAELRNANLDDALLAEHLHEQGVTHVLYNRAYFEWVMSDTDTARSRLAFALSHLEGFLDAYGVRILKGAGMELYELRSGADAVSPKTAVR